MKPSARSVRSACIQFLTRVETVIQIRSRESRSTKLTLPIGSPSMLFASTREMPSRDISSRQSVPKFETRMSPLRANASPFGSVVEMLRGPLSDDLLLAVLDPDDAAAGIGHPEGAARLGEDAFGPLKVVADVLDGVPVNAEIENRIGPDDPRTPYQLSLPAPCAQVGGTITSRS